MKNINTNSNEKINKCILPEYKNYRATAEEIKAFEESNNCLLFDLDFINDKNEVIQGRL